MSAPQTYKNHTRWDPLFHFVLAPFFLANIVVASVWCYKHFHQHQHGGPWAVALSVALLLLLMKVRNYALCVQNRVIRVEERARLKDLCSPAELVELDSLTMKQLIALRFASNPELPELARRAVRENLDPKQIKESIRSWRADNDRV